MRRPRGQASDFVRSLLIHLEASGFDAAPRALGTDERGRDIFGYIEGDVPRDLAWHADPVLVAAARLIRRYHDATAAFAAPEADTNSRNDVICHNDLSPCNFVFRAGLPAAMIDFDVAAPGTRARDVGYAAWLWLDVGSQDICADVQERRLALFLTAYGPGAPERADALSAMLIRQDELVAEGWRTGNRALAGWAEDCSRWVRAHLLR